MAPECPVEITNYPREFPGDSVRRNINMAINFVDGKYVDEKGHVKLDPTVYADWQIAEEAEKTLPSVDFFREKLGLLPE